MLLGATVNRCAPPALVENSAAAHSLKHQQLAQQRVIDQDSYMRVIPGRACTPVVCKRRVGSTRSREAGPRTLEPPAAYQDGLVMAAVKMQAYHQKCMFVMRGTRSLPELRWRRFRNRLREACCCELHRPVRMTDVLHLIYVRAKPDVPVPFMQDRRRLSSCSNAVHLRGT